MVRPSEPASRNDTQLHPNSRSDAPFGKCILPCGIRAALEKPQSAMGSAEHAIHGLDVSASCVAILIVVAHRRKEVLSARSSGDKRAVADHPCTRQPFRLFRTGIC